MPKAEPVALDSETLATRAYGALTDSWGKGKLKRTLQYNTRSAWQFYLHDERSPDAGWRRALAEFAYARALDAAMGSPDVLLNWAREEPVLGVGLVHNTQLVQRLHGAATQLAAAADSIRGLQDEVLSVHSALRIEGARAFSAGAREEFARAEQAWDQAVNFCLAAEHAASFGQFAAAVMPDERQALFPATLFDGSSALSVRAA